jgi:ParB family chromosome partitioning protein
MTKNDPKRALGKGLHALLPARSAGPRPVVEASIVELDAPAKNAHTLPIDQLKPNVNQPRRDFDEAALLELAQSIERDGIIQPIIVRRTGPADYQIIAGERRWRAARLALLKEVPVIIRQADDEKALELAIVENIQREDLNPIELATAFHRMATELGLSHDQIGQKTGKERTTITNSVRLLQLPTDVQQLIASKQLSAGHARALLKFTDPEMQREIAGQCIKEGWSVRQIEEFTRPGNGVERKDRKKPPETPPVDPNVKAAIAEMERVLGTKVRIIERSGGKGQIEIEYYSTDDLNRVYELIVENTQ